jgi:hypothetical protein
MRESLAHLQWLQSQDLPAAVFADVPAVKLERFPLERREESGCSGVMAADSLDLRERMVEAVERQGGRTRERARLCEGPASCLSKRLRQKRARGERAPVPPGGGAPAQRSAGHGPQGARGSAGSPAAPWADLQEQGQQQRRGRGGWSTGWRGGEALGGTRKNSGSAPRTPRPQRAPPCQPPRRRGPARRSSSAPKWGGPDPCPGLTRGHREARGRGGRSLVSRGPPSPSSGPWGGRATGRRCGWRAPSPPSALPAPARRCSGPVDTRALRGKGIKLRRGRDLVGEEVSRGNAEKKTSTLWRGSNGNYCQAKC